MLPVACPTLWPNVLFVAELESLETRRNNISISFFQDICEPNSCPYHLIPPARDISVTTRLRLITPFQDPFYAQKILFIYRVGQKTGLFF